MIRPEPERDNPVDTGYSRLNSGTGKGQKLASE
jgi:hypothetical protein